MLNKSDNILTNLRRLGLSIDEAKVYMELLREPSTHLRLSHTTGINRTTVYRLVEDLEKKSLVSRRTDDRGTFLTASDPSALEVRLVSQEERIKQQRDILTQILPSLKTFSENSSRDFVVQTYEGIEGLKQMCWHALQTKGEILFLGGQTLEEIIANHRWAEHHRSLNVEAGYTIREISNNDIVRPSFTANQEFLKKYTYRQLPSNILKFTEQTSIYNNTVAIFHWQKNQRVGVEIISESYADMMRQVFEHYWNIAK